jgi:hypothetical protein
MRPSRVVAVGPAHQTSVLGCLTCELVEPARRALQGSGLDIAIVRDGVITALYTVLTGPP